MARIRAACRELVSEVARRQSARNHERSRAAIARFFQSLAAPRPRRSRCAPIALPARSGREVVLQPSDLALDRQELLPDALVVARDPAGIVELLLEDPERLAPLGLRSLRIL